MLRTLTLLALLIGSSAALAEEAPPWGYGRQHGPGEWARLDPAFATCQEGTLQSPIEVLSTRKAPLPKLEFEYRATPLQLINDGHTVQINAPPGSILTVDGKVHELLQVHFHTPSEEVIRGKRYPLVAHLVHRGADGKLAVVAVLSTRARRVAGWRRSCGACPASRERHARSRRRAGTRPRSCPASSRITRSRARSPRRPAPRVCSGTSSGSR